MLQKLRLLTLGVLLIGLVIFHFLKPSFDVVFLPTLSAVSAMIIALIVALVLLIFVFRPVRKVEQSKILLEEKYNTTKNLYDLVKKQLDEKDLMVKQRTETLSTVNRINKAMISTVDLDKILELILEAAQKDLRFDRAILFLTNETLDPRKSVGLPENFDLSKLSVSLDDKSNFLVKTIIEARPRIIGETKDENIPANFKELYSSIKPEQIAVVPLVSKDEVTGLILVDNLVSGRIVEERDIRSLSTFINQAGLAIENARLFEMEKNFSDELKKQVEVAKKELEVAQEQLIKSERLSALGEMSAVVAHEVRNPMASIRAGAQRIHRKIPDTDPIKKYTTFIMDEVDRLERVVKNILTFSREPEPQLTATDMNKLLKDTLYFLDPEIKANQVRLIEAFEPTLPMVQIDPALFKQILLNILQNAIYILTDQERRELKVATRKIDAKIEIEVTDTGPGIPEENLVKIFEPFFTTKPRGTGLGLAISQRLIESHKGKIEVTSKVGHGTTFVISLPIAG
jgi:signal transduction histidine kinase